MNSDAVIGCDAVDPGAEWLRLKTVSGATRSIPWSAIKFAGTGEHMHAHITIKGLTEKVAPFLATHESLWIVYADGGFALVMLEKTSPKREAILAALAAHLANRWQGDQLQASDLMGAMMIPPKVRMPRSIVVVMALVGIAFFLAIAILFFMHGARPSAR
jgi:hypothetical protein